MKILSWLKNILGFTKNSAYVNKHMNEANIRSSIYMSFVIVAIEIWMVIRSIFKYVVPAVDNGADLFTSLFQNTSLFWLFMLAAAAMMIFSITYLLDNHKYDKKCLILTFIAGGAIILYSFALIKEVSFFTKWGTTYYNVSYIGVILLYVFLIFLGMSIIGHNIYKMKYKKNSPALSVVVVVSFAAICLTFGVKVGYTDFFSRFYLGTGLPTPKDGIYEIKSILCFLTMIIYVGCLLIWKPYISIILLVSVFTGFGILIGSDSANRVFADGEKVNYITFLISLTMITITIYHQRYKEATKSEELERIAIMDDLTGIHNYHYYISEVKRIIEKDNINLEEYYHIFINVQNFKTYNDQMGFDNGNKFLKKFAKDLEKIFDSYPTAREADDHFVTFTKVEDFEEKINELNQLFKEDAHGLYINLKVGAFTPVSTDEDINTAVDRARYAAGTIKNKYNVLYAIYDDKMHNDYVKKQYVINHIDEAIENGYIRPYYQPVVWANTKELCGCEALARWIDPVYGFLPPNDFVPTLEEVRLIHKLDAKIFECVCHDLRTLLDEGKPVVPVSLNFSRLDFELMDAIGIFESYIEKYNIPKDLVHVEITESALTDNQDELQSCLDRLHNDGFAIWLDDFGSGYSSLNVLKDFKFDVIKIDMKFLTNFEQKPETKIILDAIIRLADKLGMKTLTEGVETEIEADFLKEVGCGRLQGYLFGKPLALNELEEDINSGKYIVSGKTI